ncbi:hypothetical protein GCM10027615_32710 [Plantactinospora veratri]
MPVDTGIPPSVPATAGVGWATTTAATSATAPDPSLLCCIDKRSSVDSCKAPGRSRQGTNLAHRQRIWERSQLESDRC